MAAPATPAPAPPAAAAPSKPAAPAVAAPPPPRAGEVVDQGAVRRDSLRAQRWSARGAAKVVGDVDVDQADLQGLVSIKGRLTGGSVASNGSVDVGGAVDLTGPLRTVGEAVFRSAVRAGSLDAQGTVRAGSTISGSGGVRWSGRMELGGDLTAGPLEFEGRLETPGEVRAATIDGKLKGPSKALALRAQRVVLRRIGRFSSAGTLTVREIEAPLVEIEGTTVERIRAQEVVIGPGCQVAYVEGKVTSIHRSSHVGPVSQSPPPYGLMR